MNISNGIIKSAQKIVIYGPEGIGKSTFASKFPDPLFSDTEGSTKRLDVKRFDRPSSEEMLIQQINYIKVNPTICKTYVIDTADWFEKLCSQAVCARCKKTGIEDFGYGKGYTYIAEDFGNILNLLEDVINLGINVVVTAHAVMRKFEQPDEAGAYDRWELKLDKRTGPMLKEWADAVLFVNYKTIVEKVDDKKYKAAGGKRVMFTEHHPCWDAKNRYDLPPETEFDFSVIAPFVLSDDTKKVNENDSTVKSTISDIPSNPIADLDNIVDKTPSEESSQPLPTETPKIPEGIPKALSDLMISNNVTEEDIQLAVSQKGYYPVNTKIKDYGNDFIEGCLIACWNDVHKLILNNNDLPFN